MRVVIDTNILVSSTIRPNETFKIIFAYVAVHGAAVVPDETVAELFAVLNRKSFVNSVGQIA
jgi:predicted nucleic acid-binding protein